MFNSFLLTSSSLNAEAFCKTIYALQNEVHQKKVLTTPVHRLILQLAITTEPRHAENSILKTRLQAATDVLSARKEHKKSVRVSLKDQLILTTDEAHATVAPTRDEKKMRIKKNLRSGEGSVRCRR